jgi:homoserine kinase type II
MTEIYILVHAYGDMWREKIKILGIFSSAVTAQAALERAKQLPGFRDYPSGLSIEAHEIGRIWWEEGFIKWAEATDDDQDSNGSV